MISPDQEKTYSREELRVFNLIEQPVWVFDIVKKAMWFANTAAIELWSAKSLEDLLARNFSDDMSEATARRLDDYLVKFRNGERLKDQWTFYPNGQGPKTVETVALGIHVEEGRMAMLMQGVYKDVSDKADQRALRAVEMLRHLPVAVCQFDIEGNVMEQNPEALAAFGTIKERATTFERMNSPLDNISVSSDESTVTDIDEEDDEDVFDLPCCTQFISRFVDQQVGRKVFESVKDGKDCSLEALQYTMHGPRWSSIRVRKTKDPVTSQPVILYSARDITQVIEAKKQAEKANIAKSDFFAMMAHEIRTPLHHVVSVVELVSQSELSKDESSLHALLKSASKLLMTVINDLFDTMDGTKDKVALEHTTFNVKEVVKCTMATISPKAKAKGLDLNVNMSSRLGMMDFVGDPNRVRQILFNLLHNACKYTQSGGIELTIKRHSKIRSNRMWLRFMVKDTGVGISLHDRARLFEKSPLSQLESESGVGLSLCKALVDAMGGRIGVESHAGSGSNFWFELPFRRSTSRSNLEESFSDLDPVPDEGGLRILLADNDEINCQVMTTMLQKLGNTVVTCSDGPSMIEFVQSENFDVVLVEINLPGMSGIEATKQIRALGYSRESLPILALTSSPAQNDFVGAGLNDWLTKPLLMKDVKAAMTNAMCNCDCASSVGTSVFTGSNDGTFAKHSATDVMSDNLVSLISSGFVQPSPAT